MQIIKALFFGMIFFGMLSNVAVAEPENKNIMESSIAYSGQKSRDGYPYESDVDFLFKLQDQGDGYARLKYYEAG